MSLSRFLKVQSVDAVRMSGGKLFHAAGPATLNARFQRRRLVRGMTRSPRAEERRAERVETVDTGTHCTAPHDVDTPAVLLSNLS